MSTIKDKIKKASLPETTVSLCLDGSLVGDFEELERQLVDAQRSADADSFDDDNPAREIAEQMETLRQQMADDAVEFRLRGMSRRVWRTFIAQHPPREDTDGAIDLRDRGLLVNVDTFFPVLIRRSVISPELDDDDWRKLLGDDDQARERLQAEGKPTEDGVLTDKQFDQLGWAAWSLNRHEVQVPFSLAASRMMTTSEPE